MPNEESSTPEGEEFNVKGVGGKVQRQVGPNFQTSARTMGAYVSGGIYLKKSLWKFDYLAYYEAMFSRQWNLCEPALRYSLTKINVITIFFIFVFCILQGRYQFFLLFFFKCHIQNNDDSFITIACCRIFLEKRYWKEKNFKECFYDRRRKNGLLE